MSKFLPKPEHLEDWWHYKERCDDEFKDLKYPPRNYLDLKYILQSELCICESCKKNLNHPWDNETVKVSRWITAMEMFFLCSDCQKT